MQIFGAMNSIGRLWQITALAVFSISTLVACGESQVERYLLSGDEESEVSRFEFEPGPLQDNDGAPVVASWTQVLDFETMKTVLNVDADRVVFPREGNEHLLKFMNMDIIVSAQPNAPFLRRIIAIDDDADTITFHTMDATITEFLLSGSYDSQEDPFFGMIVDDPLLPNGLRQMQFASSTEQDMAVNNNAESSAPSSRSGPNDAETSFSMEAKIKWDQSHIRGRSRVMFEMDPLGSDRTLAMCDEYWLARDGYYSSSVNRTKSWASTEEIRDAVKTASMLAWSARWGGYSYNCILEDGEVRIRYPKQGGIIGGIVGAFTGHGCFKWLSQGSVYGDYWQKSSDEFPLFNVPFEYYHPDGSHFPTALAAIEGKADEKKKIFLRDKPFDEALHDYINYLKFDPEAEPLLEQYETPQIKTLPFYYRDQIIPVIEASNLKRKRPSYGSRNDFLDAFSTSLSTVRDAIWSTQPTLPNDMVGLDNIYAELRNNPDDDLSWLETSWEVAQWYCQGTAKRYHVGGGLDLEVQYEPSISLSVERKESYADNKSAGVNKEWVFASKHFFFMVGYVPVLLTLQGLWENSIAVEFKAGFKAEVKYPPRKAVLDFYTGMHYDSEISSEAILHTLTEFTNGEKHNYWGLAEPVTDKTEPEVKITGNMEFKAEAHTGPKFRLLLWDSVGASIGAKAGPSLKIKVDTELAGPNAGQTTCKFDAEAGFKIDTDGFIKFPICPVNKCGAKIKGTLYNTCNHDGWLETDLYDREIKWSPICAKFKGDCPLFGRGNNTATATRGTNNYSCVNCSTTAPDVNYPPGVNDVEGAYELDALYVTRNGRIILPVEVEGLSNCTADDPPPGTTYERGCAELLWRADFTECNPDKWHEKVGLIKDFSKFRVKFAEQLREGDVLHVIRQSVRASESNQDGERCQAGGNMEFYVGLVTSDGDFRVGEEPVGTNIYNSNSFRIEEKHLNMADLGPDEEEAWPDRGPDDDFGTWVEGIHYHEEE